LPERLPTTALVLAPSAFYTDRGQKKAAVAPAQKLLQRMRAESGLDMRLSEWDPERRAIEPLPSERQVVRDSDD
jgi:hypothetical protein